MIRDDVFFTFDTNGPAHAPFPRVSRKGLGGYTFYEDEDGRTKVEGGQATPVVEQTMSGAHWTINPHFTGLSADRMPPEGQPSGYRRSWLAERGERMVTMADIASAMTPGGRNGH